LRRLDCRVMPGTTKEQWLAEVRRRLGDPSIKIEINYEGDEPSVLIAMNPAALKADLGRLEPHGLLIVNSDAFGERDLAKAGYAVNPLTDDSLNGFFGFAPGYSSSQGEATCFDPHPFHGAPCRDIDKSTDESGSLGRANMTYKLDADKMIYATWSQGFRPGGIAVRQDFVQRFKGDRVSTTEGGARYSIHQAGFTR